LDENTPLDAKARVIWILHVAKAPLTFDEILGRLNLVLKEKNKRGAPVNLRKKILPTLASKNIVATLTQDDGKKVYFLSDLNPTDANFIRSIVDFARVKGRWPMIDEISDDTGVPSDTAKLLAEQYAPITGWKKTNPNTAAIEFGKSLKVAAWIRKGCEGATYVRLQWTVADIHRAKRMIELYDRFIPAITILSVGKKKFQYTYVWPDTPFDTPFGTHTQEIYEAEIARFNGYLDKLGIKK